MKKLILVLALLLILTGTVIALLQSGFAKKLTQEYIAEALQESGFTIDIGSFEGTIPRAVYLKNVSIRSDTLNISVDSLEARFSLFGLLKKQIIITDLKADQIGWNYSPQTGSAPQGIKTGLGVALEVEHFALSRVQIPDFVPVDLEGAFTVGKRNKRIYVDVTATSPSIPDGKGHISAQINKAGLLRMKGSLDIGASLSPVTAAHVQFFLRGPVHGTIYGKATGTLTPEIASLPPVLQSWLGAVWKGSARFQWLENNTWSLSRFSASNSQIKIAGSAQGGRALTEAALHIESAPFNGRLEMKQTAPEHYQMQLYGNEWQGSAKISWNPYLQMEEATLQSNSIQLQSSLAWQDQIWTGTVDGSVGNLHDLNENIYGMIHFKTRWFATEGGAQAIHLDSDALGVYWKELFSERIHISSDLINPFHHPQGTLQVNGENIKWRQLFLNSLSLQTTGGNDYWLYTLSTQGDWKHPLSLQAEGVCTHQDQTWQCLLQQASGSFYNHPLQLTAPALLTYNSNALQLEKLDIAVNDARLHLRIDHNQKADAIELSLSKFPLDILSLNPLDVLILGTTDLSLQLTRRNSDVSGQFDMNISNMTAAAPDETTPPSASGTFTGTLQKERLDLRGDLRIQSHPLLQINASLPLVLNIWPLDAHFRYDQPASGHLALDGQLGEILDFFDLGMHRIEGNCLLNLSFDNTLLHPSSKGTFRLEQGSYENYITGMQLVDLSATGTVQSNRLQMVVEALDRTRQGSVSASGAISLQPAEAFPFRFDVNFHRLEAVQIDLVTAEIEGQIEIQGNLQGAIAKGEIEVIQSDLHIPSHIPRSLPDLVVVYKNPSHPVRPISLAESKPYPLVLDIHVKAPQRIFIEGRGLASEWKGDFLLGGTYTSMAAKGTLELIKGEFVFSGRSFKLIDGSLALRGHEGEMPSINLAGSMQIKDVAITARLKGPLNNPQITLQSVPPLPMGTIMAYLLFGQDLSEINSFQALQLANSLASLAGEGPGVMESTRKALGVDRLEIVSVPNDDEELSETIAVQVGKYVSEGILVSFTQGAEDTSGNISIEIEMKHGLILQLESDQRQEQGKFTLKWNRNF